MAGDWSTRSPNIRLRIVAALTAATTLIGLTINLNSIHPPTSSFKPKILFQPPIMDTMAVAVAVTPPAFLTPAVLRFPRAVARPHLGIVNAWHTACKQWDEQASMIRELLQEQIQSQDLVELQDSVATNQNVRLQVAEVAITTQPRAGVPYKVLFATTLGSLIGQGAFSGPVRVVYYGDKKSAEYVDEAISAFEAVGQVHLDVLDPSSSTADLRAREQINQLKTAKSFVEWLQHELGECSPTHCPVPRSVADALLENEVDGSVALALNSASWSSVIPKAGVRVKFLRQMSKVVPLAAPNPPVAVWGTNRSKVLNYLNALAAHNSTNAGQALSANRYGKGDLWVDPIPLHLPLLVLNGMTLVGTLLEIRLANALKSVKRILVALRRPRSFILSLHVPYDTAEWDEFGPGMAEYPPKLFRATGALVFSDRVLREKVAEYLDGFCPSYKSQPVTDNNVAVCRAPEDILASFVLESGVTVLAMRHSLVENLDDSLDRSDDGSLLARLKQPPHSINFVDFRRPCRDSSKTRWIA
jgi:hypothetical protein